VLIENVLDEVMRDVTYNELDTVMSVASIFTNIKSFKSRYIADL
jgi:hypothetical protein